jgi:hypothetical protein
MKKMADNLTLMQSQYEHLLKQRNSENINPNVPTPKLKPSVLFGVKPSLKAVKSKCPNCKRWCLHLDGDCLELEANKDKRPANWKSVKAGL